MKSILTSLFSLVLCASLQAQLPSYVPADGLVGWWPFNGNANDESGNGNDGVVNGSTLTEDRFGNAESAYAFDGLGNYIRVLNNPNINVTGSNISLLYWIRYQNINDGQIKGLSKGGYDIGSGYELVLDFRPSSGGPNLAFNGGGGTPAGCNFSSFQNSWTCVVAVMNNGIASIYINGVQQSIWSSGSVSSFNSNSNDLYFGTRTPGNNYQGFLQGELDDIAIYNRALTPQEIAALYQAQSTNPSDTGTILPHDTLRVGINVSNPQRNLHVKDVMRLEPRNAPPANPAEGDLYYDGTRKKLRVFDGTSWKECW